MGGIQTIDVRLEPAHAGWRLDRALAAAVPTLSRERLKALIRSGAVETQGKAVRDPATKVRGGESLRVEVPEPKPAHNEPQDIPLKIAFEDEHLLVVDKPAGLVVHPAAGNFDGTLVNALLHHCGETLSGIGGVARPGIVHRIDKDTSGLLVVAKHDAAHLALSAQLSDRSLKRTYLAVAWGKPEAAQGTIRGNIGRSIANRQKMAVVKTGGKPATTHYKVVASDKWQVVSKKKSSDSPLATRHLPLFSLLECNLETGRTHQIRVHLAHIGHPLIGDPAYGTRAGRAAVHAGPAGAAIAGFPRQALHARLLGFRHPATGDQLRFDSALPSDLVALLANL